MKRTSAFLSLFFLLVLASGAAWADCRYNGKDYPPGTVIKGMVCTQSGWQKL